MQTNKNVVVQLLRYGHGASVMLTAIGEPSSYPSPSLEERRLGVSDESSSSDVKRLGERSDVAVLISSTTMRLLTSCFEESKRGT